MPIFNENNAFFVENERFSGLIKCYARRLKGESALYDLWDFLFELLASAKRPLSDRYIAVCLRNEWIRMSKAESALPVPVEEIYSSSEEAVKIDLRIDFKIDFSVALSTLTKKELEVISLHFYYGFSINEVARLNKISPQAVNKTKLRALEKLRLKML